MKNNIVENEHLEKRCRLLEKRSSRCVQVQQQVDQIENLLQDASSTWPCLIDDVIANVLNLIQESGASLIRWMPGKTTQHTFFLSKAIRCEMHGSFEQLDAVLKTLAHNVYCDKATITKRKDTLICSCRFILLTYKESSQEHE